MHNEDVQVHEIPQGLLHPPALSPTLQQQVAERHGEHARPNDLGGGCMDVCYQHDPRLRLPAHNVEREGERCSLLLHRKFVMPPRFSSPALLYPPLQPHRPGQHTAPLPRVRRQIHHRGCGREGQGGGEQKQHQHQQRQKHVTVKLVPPSVAVSDFTFSLLLRLPTDPLLDSCDRSPSQPAIPHTILPSLPLILLLRALVVVVSLWSVPHSFR
mmetsp:Transcript_5032/g.18112  ORF Transcript_5032/g.18112 Transcript_5032/m.18112 type:complete len:213 (+) Transcript_5032:883-1521(+)